MKYGKWSERRQTKRKIFGSPLVLFGLVVLFIILARATWGIHDKAKLSDTKLSQATAELDKLKVRQGDLASQVDRLSTEQGVEAEIRSKYKGVKDGESVAVIIDEGQTASVAEASTTVSVSWWKSLLQKVGL